ncbi:MAG TPA: ABC transporter transmembrane domain-containing protein [Saprospiraceae bacterium]|nr:ABC transporter transmembrane domain-containing protein [Saprospiraceae bacterium]
MSDSAKKDPEKKAKITKDSLMASMGIFRYIKPYRGYFIAGMVLLVLGSVLFMAFPGVAGEMANIAVGKDKYNLNIEVEDFWWIFLIILVGQGILSYFRTIFFTIVSEKGMADLRKDLYDKIITQSIGFFEERRIGELTSRITTDVEQMQTAFSITLAEFLRQVIMLVVGVIIIAALTPKLSLIMLGTFPIIVIIAVVFGRYIRKLSKKRQDKLAETNTIVEETFQSFSVVKSFANEWLESIRYSKSVGEVVKISIEFAKIRGLFFAFIITILFGGFFFILWRGALLVKMGQMEVGDLFSFIIYTGILGGAIASFSTLYATLAQAIGATERVMDIINGGQEVTQIDGPATPADIKGAIKFDNVQFSYPSRSDLPVLKGINLNIEKGNKIALVGQSGSGKSTIVQLLMKFYQISGGKISIDGKDINEYNISQLRSAMAIVPQEVILFGGTIRENILYGKPTATEFELEEAARKSNSLEFINSFPDGFQTIVGDRGIKLSGGQRQRIAIARAILKDPAILILDEATSSLDAGSEKVVQDALDFLLEGRTSIIIAHRLSTIKDVDHIYVLDKGTIAEEGSHEELLAKEDGIYNNLAKLQFDVRMANS